MLIDDERLSVARYVKRAQKKSVYSSLVGVIFVDFFLDCEIG